MKKRKIINSLTYDHGVDGDYETPYGVSDTIPDDALSLRQLLDDHTRGKGIPVRKPIFLGEEVLPDVTRMNKIEILEAIRETERLISDERRKLQLFTEEQKIRDIEDEVEVLEDKPKGKPTRKRKSVADDDKKEADT